MHNNPVNSENSELTSETFTSFACKPLPSYLKRGKGKSLCTLTILRVSSIEHVLQKPFRFLPSWLCLPFSTAIYQNIKVLIPLRLPTPHQEARGSKQ